MSTDARHPGDPHPAAESSRGTLARALSAGPLTLDGGLSTELARRGYDVEGALWSARLLRDDPDAVVAAHAAFLAAGARVITTASYQATFEGFARAGVPLSEARALMQRSVRLARQAQQQDPVDRDTWVAASVGPYGAMLADGSEYTGAYAALFWTGRAGGGLTAGELRAFHRPRLAALAEAGADALALETVPCLVEAEALVAEVAGLGVPAWLSMTTVLSAEGEPLTRRGEPAGEAFALARGVDEIVAVGVNCTDPAGVERAVEVAARASGKPVVVYPNSGEGWDAAARAWTGDAGATDWAGSGLVNRWTAAGARLVGGCCRVGPEAVAGLAAHLEG